MDDVFPPSYFLPCFRSRMGYPTHEAHSVVPFRNFNEEMKRAGVWDQGGTSVGDSSQDNLASLYRPPFALMHHGPFEKVMGFVLLSFKFMSS